MLYQKILINIFAFLFAYLIGSLNWSIIYSKKTVKGDIRNQGSKNAGATNVARNYNMSKGLIIFFLDVFKLSISGLIIWALTKWGGGIFSSLIIQLGCLGAFIGHLYPIYYRFKGGKGVSSYYGFLLIFNPLLFVISYLSSYLIYKKWKYISIGSVTMPFIIFALSWIPWMNNGPLTYFMTHNIYFWVNPFCIFMMGIIILIRHRKNIRRLLDGNENLIK